MVKNLPASAGDVGDMSWSLGREDPLEEGMATHSRILDWRGPWTEEPGVVQSMGSQIVGRDWSDSACTYLYILFGQAFCFKCAFFSCWDSGWLFRELKGEVTTKGWRSWNHFSWNSLSVGKFKFIMLFFASDPVTVAWPCSKHLTCIGSCNLLENLVRQVLLSLFHRWEAESWKD